MVNGTRSGMIHQEGGSCRRTQGTTFTDDNERNLPLVTCLAKLAAGGIETRKAIIGNDGFTYHCNFNSQIKNMT